VRRGLIARARPIRRSGVPRLRIDADPLVISGCRNMRIRAYLDKPQRPLFGMCGSRCRDRQVATPTCLDPAAVPVPGGPGDDRGTTADDSCPRLRLLSVRDRRRHRGAAAGPDCRTASWWRRIKISAVFHASRRDSRCHAASRVIRRNTNRRHIIGDHHGRSAGRATLLVRAADGILGTQRQPRQDDQKTDVRPRHPDLLRKRLLLAD
jgi:hypothetical protein